MRINFLPYNQASASVKALRDACRAPGHELEVNKLTAGSPRYRKLLDLDRAPNSFVQPNLFVQWGNFGHIHNPGIEEGSRNVLVLNGNTEAVRDCVDKKKFFQKCAADGIAGLNPRVFYTKEDAADYLEGIKNVRAGTPRAGTPALIQRNSLNASGGDGIYVLSDVDVIPNGGKLWTSYVKKKFEFRVHVSKRYGSFCAQRKLLPAINVRVPGGRDTQYTVRNYENGWRYSSVDVGSLPACVRHAANRYRVTMPQGLDFVALDIIYNEQSATAYILEANTAPGVEQVTAEKYRDLFKGYCFDYNFAEGRYNV